MANYTAKEDNRLIDGGKEESFSGRLFRAGDEGGAMRIMEQECRQNAK